MGRGGRGGGGTRKHSSFVISNIDRRVKKKKKSPVPLISQVEHNNYLVHVRIFSRVRRSTSRSYSMNDLYPGSPRISLPLHCHKTHSGSMLGLTWSFPPHIHVSLCLFLCLSLSLSPPPPDSVKFTPCKYFSCPSLFKLVMPLVSNSKMP